VEGLREDLDQWLAYYNTEKPYQGYRNQGKRPLERIKEYLESVGHDRLKYTYISQNLEETCIFQMEDMIVRDLVEIKFMDRRRYTI